MASIVEWCDRRHAYHRGIVKWANLEAAEVPFTDEHRKGMLDRLRDLMHGLFDKESQEAAE